MFGFDHTQPMIFDEWLAIATRGLCDHARERIREELECHYLDAYDALIEDGVSEVDAEAQSVAELGSPKKAQRRFIRMYLTKREDYYLESNVFNFQSGSTVKPAPVPKMDWTSRILLLLMFGGPFLLIVGILFAAGVIQDSFGWFIVGSVGTFLALAFAGFALLIKLAPKMTCFGNKPKSLKVWLKGRMYGHFAMYAYWFYLPMMDAIHGENCAHGLDEIIWTFPVYAFLASAFWFCLGKHIFSLHRKLKCYPLHNMTPAMRKIMALTGERLDIDSDKPREQ